MINFRRIGLIHSIFINFIFSIIKEGKFLLKVLILLIFVCTLIKVKIVKICL